jgi:hypothetical protein
MSGLGATTFYSIHSIGEKDMFSAWVYHCESFIEQIDTSKRTLFVLHYAGHGTENSTSEALTLAATATEADAEPGKKTRLNEEISTKCKAFYLNNLK